MRAIIFVSLCLVLASSVLGLPNCPGPNEEFTECGTCAKTCEQPKGPDACLAVCYVGCVCKPGYLRNNNNICVQKSQC